MREKISLKDFNVLLICQSNKWATIERRALADSVFLRDSGGNPTLLCIKGSQLDVEAEKEDIPRVYLGNSKEKSIFDIRLYFEFNSLLKNTDYEIVHTYSFYSTLMCAFILKTSVETPLFFTLNQIVKFTSFKFMRSFILNRVDSIFTLSEQVQEYARESLEVNPIKVKNLGLGLDVLKTSKSGAEEKILGCVINNIAELKRLKYVVKVFRVLKNYSQIEIPPMKLFLFLGPRIYQKDKAKKILKELEYEFYEGDIFLYNLESRLDEVKKVDIVLGLSFDEPVNDYEIMALINGKPVLLPRTAARQSLLFKYRWIGESYFEGDIREAKTKIEKILMNFSIYTSALKEFSTEIVDTHGIDRYAELFERYYVQQYVKRQRLLSKKKVASSLT